MKAATVEDNPTTQSQNAAHQVEYNKGSQLRIWARAQTEFRARIMFLVVMAVDRLVDLSIQMDGEMHISYPVATGMTDVGRHVTTTESGVTMGFLVVWMILARKHMKVDQMRFVSTYSA